jgi:sarcosine oxidase
MANRSFDVIVVGLGAMGSAAAYHLAKAGHKVLGLDRYVPPHTFGSSHGQTRIIREAYFEHPSYVPLVQRAYQLWAELERETGDRLFQQTGGLMIGPRDGIVFTGARSSAEQHGLPHEVLTSTQIRQRFPVFETSEDMAAIWEPRAGILFPEKCIEAHLGLAKRAGADLRFNEPVQDWHAVGSSVEVRTAVASYSGGQMLCSAGAWIGDLVRDLTLPLTVERQVLYWFEPCRHDAFFQPEMCPIYIFEFEQGRFFYGFPDWGNGVKVARHHEGAQTHPDKLDREVYPSEVEEMRAILRKFLPDAEGTLRSTAVCMYTDAPDGHFVIDRHPGFPQVLLASPAQDTASSSRV